MTTPKQVIDRLREDYGCALREERIIEMINALEARLATDVLRKKAVCKKWLNKGEHICHLEFPANRVLRVSLSGREIRKTDMDNPCGFHAQGTDIVLDFACGGGEVCIEYLVIPEPFTQTDYVNRALMLDDGYTEIYLYHILSREALLNDDIERLNNYSTIYAQALRSLIASGAGDISSALRYTKIW